MEKACKYGKMDRNMRATGKMTWLMGKEDSFILTVMFMKASGLTIRLTEREYIFIWTELNITETGERINNTGLELRPGLMGLSMKATMNMEKNMERVLLNGLTARNILVNSITITSTAKEFILGAMEEDMKVSGKTIKCMARELLLGLMAESTLVNI